MAPHDSYQQGLLIYSNSLNNNAIDLDQPNDNTNLIFNSFNENKSSSLWEFNNPILLVVFFFLLFVEK